jgi:PIN domain nuclease of toxin-antitoxin system
MRTFLDTHAWVWWVTRDPRISSTALAAIGNAIGREGVWLSAISIWEVAKKVEKGQLVLDRPIRAWIESALGMNGLFVAELTNEILLESCDLPKPFHGDFADQMIVATVRHYGGKLITKDRALHGLPAHPMLPVGLRDMTRSFLPGRLPAGCLGEFRLKSSDGQLDILRRAGRRRSIEANGLPISCAPSFGGESLQGCPLFL